MIAAVYKRVVCWALGGRALSSSSSSGSTSSAIHHAPLFRCGSCEGRGMRFVRRNKKRPRKLEEFATNKVAGKGPSRPCPECDGSGLLPIDAPVVEGPAKVVIVGGGIGGLALALALQHRGVAVAVYERDRSMEERPAGYGLTIQQGGRALRSLGLLKAARDMSTYTDCHVAFGDKGELLGVYGNPDADKANQPPSTDDKQLYYAIHLPRQSLRGLLYSRLRPGTVRWGHELLPASSAGELRFQTQDPPGVTKVSCEKGVVVVGADGVFSRCRDAFLASDRPLRDVGVFVTLGYARLGTEELIKGRQAKTLVFEAVDGDARLYAMPFDPLHGTTMWQLSWRIKAEAPLLQKADRGPRLKELALAATREWDFELARSLISATRPEDVTGYPIVDRDPETLVAALPPSTVLIGDAAHPMAPFKAQGANQALLDAIDLARLLYDSELGDEAATLLPPATSRRRSASAQEAIEAFHAEMLPRAANKIRASKKAAELLHSEAACVRSFGTTRAYAANASLADLQLKTTSSSKDATAPCCDSPAPSAS